MTVLKNDNRWDKSNVDFRGGVLIEYNKHEPRPEMLFIDYGLGVFRASSLERNPIGQAFDLAEAYHSLSIEGKLAGHEVHERFYEVGSLSGIKETENYILHMNKS